MNARTIQDWSKEFCSDIARCKVTIQVGTTFKRTWIDKPKERFKFGTILRGQNRRNRSIIWDERLRAKATVWLRLNNKKKKNKPSMKAEDFRLYLETDLLAHTGKS